MNIPLVSQNHHPTGLLSPCRQSAWEYRVMQGEDKSIVEYLSQVLGSRTDPGEYGQEGSP